MKRHRLILFLFFLFLAGKSSSQDFKISTPKLEFDGNQLLISYDILNENKTDLFYVWVEIEKNNGEEIPAKSLSGDIGDLIKPLGSKQIMWAPARDHIVLNEEVFIEVKAEKYVKSFNRSSIMLMSAAMPGLGQTRISGGKPWWLIGVASYGAVAGGLITHKSYLNTYDSYRVEEDPGMRTSLLDQAQQQLNTSNLLFVSGATLWAANLVWAAMFPNKYLPLQHVNLSVNHSTDPYHGNTLLSLSIKF